MLFRSPQNSPEWSAYYGMTWRGDIMGGEIRVTPSLSYRSDYHLFDTPDPILDQDGYVLADASVVWTAPSRRWEVGLFGRNLTNAYYWSNVAKVGDVARRLTGEPVTYGIQLSAKM